VNISISELMLILLVALLVIKPAQLPEVARTVGRVVKFLQRLLNKVKREMIGLLDSDEH
jgi:Sec-independent protein translocase protein TatA